MTKKINIKPLFDNVLIKPLEAEAKTASGIILPDSAKEKPQIGLVMAVGLGKIGPKGEKHPVVVKVGNLTSEDIQNCRKKIYEIGDYR